MVDKRVLVVGPLGPPHIEDQVLGLAERGIDVVAGGNAQSSLDDTVIEDAGVTVRRAPDLRLGTPWGMTAAIRWLRRVLAEVEPDLVHAHWLPGFAFAAARCDARPLVVSAWGSDVYRARGVKRLAGRSAARSADLVLADSRDLLEACVAYGVDPKNTAEVQWGVDLSIFSPAVDRQETKRKLGLGPGPVILSPRSLMEVYNIPTIIKAFGRLADRNPDVQLVIKHMGAEMVELPPIPHVERVRKIGKVSYQEMADYFRAADVCISATSSDSSPRSIWEAMACGAPCVVSDLPWVTEMLTPGRDVITCRVDEDDIAAKLDSVLSDRGLAEALSSNARALIESRLDRERQLDHLVELYDELLTR